MTSREKLTVICFDETYVSNRLCYDKKNEHVIGPHKCVQTVVVRGLTSNWKQPIFYDYDTKMTKELLFNIIEELHKIDFNVIAMVSDMGPSTWLWRTLNISIENTTFEHPTTSNKIHVFADVPHLLKLARNHLFDNGFVLPNSKYVGKSILQTLLKIDSGDLKLAYRLTERHLEVQGCGRMNVKLASQVFSDTVAKAIAYCGEKNYLDKQNWKDASEMILLFNNWFDIFNTQHKFDGGTPSYGINLEHQDEFLDKMSTFILEMRVYGKKTLVPFQKGIAVCNKSLKSLLKYLKDEHGMEYIIGRRLNQDIIENLFSFLKGMTGSASSSITALDFKYWQVFI
ncbi:unnamed protein product [Macrosiphum euphorbiae]|uniref:Transposase n=1 Tax=Macrosiphum euphorbiae TaxID=13131 RepID=A0AAV0WZU3_9HEMI|nr:unnamed protein product [Macrosiphum euphorbiae]